MDTCLLLSSTTIISQLPQQLLRISRCERMRRTGSLFARNTEEGWANLYSMDLIGRRNPKD